jgi:hypothetical protein
MSSADQTCHASCTGTVADFDDNDQLGLVESDDGRIMPFNLTNVAPATRGRFAVGRRVRFVERHDGLVARATALVLIEGEYSP